MDWPRVWLLGGMIVVGIGIAVFTVLNFTPILRSPPPSEYSKIPPIADFDYSGWRALPVQDHGRYKPFETACREAMRLIVGREKLEGQDATSVVLMWMLEKDQTSPPQDSKWDNVEFILCQHGDLRTLIYQLDDAGKVQKGRTVSSDELHGWYMSPKQLRDFRARLSKLRQDNLEAFKDTITPVERQYGEVQERLALYESIRGYSRPQEDRPPMMKEAPEKPSDPFGFVGLDAVPGSPWFSMADLRLIQRKPAAWHEVFMAERVAKAPQLYIGEKRLAALREFQKLLLAGNTEPAFAELNREMQARRQETVAKYEKLRKETGPKNEEEAQKILENSLMSAPMAMIEGQPQMAEDLRKAAAHVFELDQKKAPEAAAALDAFLAKRDARVLDDLRKQVATARREGYDPEQDKFRMLHLTYLETRFPNMYKDAVTDQPVPKERVERVLIAWSEVGQAYRSGNPERFESASQKFLQTLEAESTKPYPGQDSIGDRVHAVLTGAPLNPPDRGLLALEQTFNKVVPFQKAWVLMLVSVLFFCLSLGLDSRGCYLAAWAFFIGSLGFQLFGFFVRVIISGRPPVTNMYETVIWVAFMSAIFGAILEAVYRKKVIALAAAMVATLGLVLADQMPLALDPKINPLVPVLRSNFWLTIHVLTIVSSYAGGTLAWGLANVSLFLIIFGKNKADTIKMLSTFIYRALQIAVLLLAAGTFLGGWWAAYSWGRFWGWDPKETGALIALVCYVIPLHMRYIGWIRDFGMAVSGILCYAMILFSWYGINFVVPAGLHSYGVGNGGAGWVYWAGLINIQWVLVATWMYWNRQEAAAGARSSVGVSTSAPLVSSEAIQAT
jgi:ABC-type transport system involved in cytochrome c biogenesis permease subunit